MPIGDTFVEKVKATQLFHESRLPRLRKAVSVVHRITSVATLFAKAHYLQHIYPTWRAHLEQGLPPPAGFAFDQTFWKRVFSIIKHGRVQTRGGQGNDVDPAVQSMIEDFNESPFFADQVKDRAQYNELSLSPILNYSAEQLETCYTNNAVAHYSSYVQKFVVHSLRWMAMQHHGVTTFDAFAERARRAVDTDARRAFNDVLEGHENETLTCRRDDFRQWVLLWRRRLRPERTLSFDDDIEARPFEYIPYMVYINHLIEGLPPLNPTDLPQRLYSPLPLRSSFVPTHMTIDTPALLQLFVDDVHDFKHWYQVNFGVDLVNLRTKADLTATLGKQLGRRTTQ